MSIDTTKAIETPPHSDGAKQKKKTRQAKASEIVNESASWEQWDALRFKAAARSQTSTAESVFGKSAKGGSVYRWGIAIARGRACDDEFVTLTKLACENPAGKLKGSGKPKKSDAANFAPATESFLSTIEHASAMDVVAATEAVTWAAALPTLARNLEVNLSWRLLEELQRLHEAVIARGQIQSPTHLILGGELGLTLAWRMQDIPSCKQLQAAALDAIDAWCELADDAITMAVAGVVDARVVLASLMRCQSLMAATTKRKFKKKHLRTGDLLATWVTAMTTNAGGSAFSVATRKDIVDDVAAGGLLDMATTFDPESLEPAMAAALGASHTGGQLAWEVCLPEAMWHDNAAKLAVMLPEWDVRRGRTHIDYSGENVAIEVYGGRHKVFDGTWTTTIELAGEEQHACGEWSESCEYTDDDVHYLEIEQPWTGGLLLQRQLMLIREDRCLFVADAVVTDGHRDDPADLQRSIRYQSHFPLAGGTSIDPEPETRDVFLSDGKRRALVMPISAAEWRVGPTSAKLEATDESSMTLAANGKGRLYAPLWIDFSQRRFKRKRTWRQLTVVDDLRLCGREEAAGYRIQVGSEQWMVYRTLGHAATRSVLGKHLIADFFASRFDPTEGDHDALVTVEDNESSE